MAPSLLSCLKRCALSKADSYALVEAQLPRQQISLIYITNSGAVDLNEKQNFGMSSLPLHHDFIPTNYRTGSNHLSARPQRRQALSIITAFSCCILLSLSVLSIVNMYEVVSSVQRLLALSNRYSPSTPSDATVAWESLRGGEHCLRHATREYTARLRTIDLPPGEDPMRACRDTPVEIHGQMLYTSFCQNLGFGRGVWGFWAVDFDEPDCETHWGSFNDLGCVDDEQYPARRVESRLRNLQPGSDWQFMCVTTPADINGQHYFTPTDCLNLGHANIHGLWDIPDNSCSQPAFHEREERQ